MTLVRTSQDFSYGNQAGPLSRTLGRKGSMIAKSFVITVTFTNICSVFYLSVVVCFSQDDHFPDYIKFPHVFSGMLTLHSIYISGTKFHR